MMSRRYGFLFLDGFALMSAASAIEPLRAANLIAGAPLYEPVFVSRKGGPVRASCGASFDTLSFRDAPADFGTLFVVAGGNPMLIEDERLVAYLRGLDARRGPLGGISGGAVVLARAGLMANRRFTVHWEHFEALRELSSEFLLERRLFVLDRDRATCAGGVAPLDMMHALIRAAEGARLAEAISDWFIHTGVRAAEDPQRASDIGEGALLRRSVAATLRLMEDHIADTLSLPQLAELVGLSPRQLQRAFEADLGESVMARYARLRLEKSDELLRQTRMPIAEIAYATGFSSQSNFSRAYRRRFDVSPRARRAAAQGRASARPLGAAPPPRKGPISG